MNGFDVSFNRHGGNPESNMAFDRSKASHEDVRDRIERMVAGYDNGLTLHEIAERLGKQVNTISGRLTELYTAGRLDKCGRREGGAIYVKAEKQRRLL